MSKKTLREEIKKWKAEQKLTSSQDGSIQSTSDDVNVNDLKKVTQLFTLLDHLAQLPHFDQIIQKFTDNNRDKTKKLLMIFNALAT